MGPQCSPQTFWGGGRHDVIKMAPVDMTSSKWRLLVYDVIGCESKNISDIPFHKIGLMLLTPEPRHYLRRMIDINFGPNNLIVKLLQLIQTYNLLYILLFAPRQKHTHKICRTV